MTKRYCNGCGGDISPSYPREYKFQIYPIIKSDDGEEFMFDSLVSIGSWRFNSTDIDFCRTCQLKAFKEAVANLE